MIRRWIANNIALLAVSGETPIDARSLISLQKTGALAEIKRSATPFGSYVEIVINPRHPRRVSSLPGPCLLISPEDGSSTSGVFCVADLFLEEKPAHRKVALEYFDGLCSAGLLTPRCLATIADCRSSLLSRDGTTWRSAAIKIYDAAERDWLLNLSGLRQAMDWAFDEGVGDYLTRVLRPTVASIDSISLTWWDPQGQREEIGEAIDNHACGAKTLSEAATQYYRELGHLPLSQEAGMGRLVSGWNARNGEATDTWNQLWEWANATASPVARYHVCQAALTNPGLIPTVSVDDFWLEMRHILTCETEEGGKWFNAWQFRLRLARHFCRYLEVLIPWNDGVRLPIFAWWLTEQVASVFNGLHINLDVFEANFFSVSFLHWHLARARAAASELRSQTLFESSIWTRSLLSYLGKMFNEIDLVSLDSGTHEAIENAYFLHEFQGFRYKRSSANPICNCDLPLDEAVRGWTALFRADERTQRIGKFFELLEATRNEPLDLQIADSGLQGEQLSYLALRAAAYDGNLPVESLERIFRNDDTATQLLTELDDAHIQALTDIIFESAAASSGEWRVVVPHALATACLRCEDSKRSELLFTLVVHCSVATDTVSALRCLLTTKERHRFIDLSDRCRVQLFSQLGSAPQWLSARIRSVVAELDG